MLHPLLPRGSMSAAAPTEDAAHPPRQSEADPGERLAAAAKLASSGKPGLSALFDALYAGAAPDDINRYEPASLAALARMVHARVLAHKSGQSDVTLVCARDEDKDYGENDFLLVAINVDKPFLFDSLIADVSAGGGRLRAVF